MMTDLQSARAWLKGRRPSIASGDALEDRICEWHMGHALTVESPHVELVRSRAGEIIGMFCVHCRASVSRASLAHALELSALRQRQRLELAADRARAALERVPSTCVREGCTVDVRAIVAARRDGWGRARRYCSAQCRERVKSQRATAKRRAKTEGSRNVK